MRQVYKINLPDGRGYIGVTHDPKRRFTNHFNSRTPLGEAMRTAGRDAIVFEIITSGDDARMIQLEQDLIDLEGTLKPDGFNTLRGGSATPLKDDALDASITVRLPATVKAALEKLADAEQRTLSAYVAIKLAEIVKHAHAPKGARV